MSDIKQTNKSVAPVANIEHDATSQPNTQIGIRGWLKFFIIFNMYILPILFVLRYILAWIGFTMLSEDYPRVILIGLIETGIGGFLVVKWIQIARRLRDIQPGIIREVNIWLKVSLGWIILSTPISFISGMDAVDLLPNAIKVTLGGLISFSIWYSYFNVSKRVRATYPDWDLYRERKFSLSLIITILVALLIAAVLNGLAFLFMTAERESDLMRQINQSKAFIRAEEEKLRGLDEEIARLYGLKEKSIRNNDSQFVIMELDLKISDLEEKQEKIQLGISERKKVLEHGK